MYTYLHANKQQKFQRFTSVSAMYVDNTTFIFTFKYRDILYKLNKNGELFSKLTSPD